MFIEVSKRVCKNSSSVLRDVIHINISATDTFTLGHQCFIPNTSIIDIVVISIITGISIMEVSGMKN